MTEQLWGDERIDQRTTEISKELYDNALHPASGRMNNVAALKQLTREMRNSYEQRLTDLEAENERLRALLPDAQARVTLDIILRFAEADHGNETPFGSQITHCQQWLERLERP